MSSPLPLIAVNTLSLAPGALAQHVETVVRLGAAGISPDLQDFTACSPLQAARLLADAGLQVATLTHRAFGFASPELAAAQRERLDRTLELAHAIGAPSICMTTGGRGELSWPAAAARFVAEIAPCAERARAAGVTLGIEPTSHLYADASIVHRLADVVTLARQAGVGVGIDLFPCWMDADIEAAIAAAGPLCAFVQVSDYVLGDRGLPCRAVPGDGAAQLDRLIGLILATGYRGPFDLEIIGPRLEAEGRDAGLKRAIAWLGDALDRARP
ncbi:sugar phosphate isomerase/epimerase [Phenylobacterium sp. LjRoot219]|uniref:sugar phosphate isomerase/epimerase family protein n=1 Tax=Phenylobacterium sp. LjRoot219 TaxID=3342283 RepID=UPI003ECF9BE9